MYCAAPGGNEDILHMLSHAVVGYPSIEPSLSLPLLPPPSAHAHAHSLHPSINPSVHHPPRTGPGRDLEGMDAAAELDVGYQCVRHGLRRSVSQPPPPWWPVWQKGSSSLRVRLWHKVSPFQASRGNKTQRDGATAHATMQHTHRRVSRPNHSRRTHPFLLHVYHM